MSGLRILVSLADSSPQWCSTMLAEPLCLSNILRLVITFRPDRKSNSNVRSGFRSPVKSNRVLKLDSDDNSDGEGEGEKEGGEVDMEANKMDILCLALALLTHLVQSTSHAAAELREKGMYSN